MYVEKVVKKDQGTMRGAKELDKGHFNITLTKPENIKHISAVSVEKKEFIGSFSLITIVWCQRGTPLCLTWFTFHFSFLLYVCNTGRYLRSCK